MGVEGTLLLVLLGCDEDGFLGSCAGVGVALGGGGLHGITTWGISLRLNFGNLGTSPQSGFGCEQKYTLNIRITKNIHVGYMFILTTNGSNHLVMDVRVCVCARVCMYTCPH